MRNIFVRNALLFSALLLSHFIGSLSLAATFSSGNPIKLTQSSQIRFWPDKGVAGIQPANASGVVTGGPTNGIWYKIDFASGVDGWVQENVLVAIQTTPVLPKASITANPSQITLGSSSTLNWSSSNALDCVASGSSEFTGSVSLSGSRVVTPLANTTYSLLCKGSGGSVSVSVQVAVVVPAPVLSILASPQTINIGESSKLTWNSTNASSCVASGSADFNGSIPTSGSKLVFPTSSTQYRVDCSGAGGKTNSAAQVTVLSAPPPPIASPVSGDRIELLSSTSVRFYPGKGSPGFQGAGALGQIISGPIQVNWYNINFDNGVDGYVQSTDFKLVSTNPTNPPPAPNPVPSIVFSANPSSINAGASTTLSWSSLNTSSCSASGSTAFSGAVATSGTRSVSPAASTSFSLNCTGPGGSASASVLLTVLPVAPPPPAGNGVLMAFSDPTNGNVPFSRLTRTDSDEVRKLAFPSAEGVGKFADPDIGPGQNFTVYKVTNLNDSGPGSLRDCYLAVGPRVCIFEVSGTITVDSDMMLRNGGDVYLAGQTSPGGIQLKSGPNNDKGPLRALRSSDLVFRFLKLRPGDGHALSSDVDSLTINGNQLDRDSHDIMLDHLSMQWSTDETAHLSGATNLTLQWSIASEPLRCGSCVMTTSPLIIMAFLQISLIQ